ncbi:MAG TPA: hypothetical protein VIK37_01200 [Candidatus Saccharimonadales bacterium]
MADKVVERKSDEYSPHHSDAQLNLEVGQSHRTYQCQVQYMRDDRHRHPLRGPALRALT